MHCRVILSNYRAIYVTHFRKITPHIAALLCHTLLHYRALYCRVIMLHTAALSCIAALLYRSLSHYRALNYRVNVMTSHIFVSHHTLLHYRAIYCCVIMLHFHAMYCCVIMSHFVALSRHVLPLCYFALYRLLCCKQLHYNVMYCRVIISHFVALSCH